jgi:hypothetical protein
MLLRLPLMGLVRYGTKSCLSDGMVGITASVAPSWSALRLPMSGPNVLKMKFVESDVTCSEGVNVGGSTSIG